jgi:NADPH:quinone reductase-like Zn-dependent oxidoreductase
MKAVILNENGGPDKLVYTEDFPIPEIKPDEVLVKLKATTINRADLVIRTGYPGLSLSFPHILGGDIAGVIEETGSNVKGFKKGDNVISWSIVACGECEWCKKGRGGLCFNWQYFGMHRKGSYAEYTEVPASSLIKLPDNVSFEDAACLPVAGLTAYHALGRIGSLKKGETFFVWGGASGLGMMAIQIAKNAGAKVFATAGTEEKINHIKELGVEYVFNHRTEEDIPVKVLGLTDKRGIDVVLDYIGPATYPKSFQMVKKGGRILWCGIMTGREATVSIHQTYLRHVSLLGLYLGEKEELEELVKLVSQDKVKPYIGETLDLKNAAKGHQLIWDGKVTGKVVMIVD